MPTFPSRYFTFSTRYPESGARIQLGGSYQFDTPPEAPDQRVFILKIPGLKYFVDENGAIDPDIYPDRNMATLEAFYNEHKRAFPFTFNHPVYGPIECKFLRPLEIPDGIVGGDGVVSMVEVELLEIP